MRTKTLQIEKKKMIVPQLRFPGFEGEWEIEKLKDISKIERGRFSPRPRNNPIYYNGEIPFVQTSDVVNSNGKIEFYTQTLNEKGLAVSKLFPKGSILITIAANIGHSGVLQIDMACPDSLIGIKPNKDIDNYYLNYYLSTHQKKMDYLAPEGAQKNINIEFLNPYKVPTTTLKEQQKIASFLSAVDDKIQQLCRRKVLVGQYKKGVMQQLFSGKLRFKDENGQDYPDLEETRIGKIFEHRNETGYNEMELLSVSINNGVYSQSQSNKIDNSNSDKSKYKRVLIGDIAYNSMRMWQGASSVSTLDGIVSPAYTILQRNENNCSEYFGYLFKMRYMIQTFQKHSQGLTSDTWNLKYPMISKIKVKRPCLKEQQKIANFLSGIDGKIEQVNGELVKTQEFKKGLLQQMFV